MNFNLISDEDKATLRKHHELSGTEIILRPYQVECVDGLRENIRRRIMNQILCAPTGAGKTVIGAHLIRECYHKGKRAVFVCDRISLIDQTSAFFDKFGIPHGVIQADHWRRKPGERIQIGSAQTLMRRGWPDADLIIVDEAHCCYKSTIDRISRRDAVTIGLTATPFTKGLGRHYDAVVTVTTTNKLTLEKYLATFRVFAASEPDMEGAKVVAGEWTEHEAESRAMPIIGDAVAEYLKHGEGKKFIAFGCSVAHCAELHRQFLAAGVMCDLYTYLTPDDERAASITEFRKQDGWLRGLISVSALSKGFDVDSVGVIIMCRPLKSSLAEHIQILGRGLRPHPCKAENGLIVLDHSGNFVRFWHETNDFFENSVDTLDDGKPKPPKKKSEEEKKPVKCPKCHHVFGGGPVCPACGYIFPPKAAARHMPGELHELNSSTKTLSRDDKRQLFGELKQIGLNRGYKEGWAANKFREFAGVWPNGHRDAPLQIPSLETLSRVRKSARAWAAQNKAA